MSPFGIVCFMLPKYEKSTYIITHTHTQNYIVHLNIYMYGLYNCTVVIIIEGTYNENVIETSDVTKIHIQY